MRGLITIALVAVCLQGAAQTTGKSWDEKQQVMRYAEKMPEADYNVDAYIQQHIQYPAAALANKEQGRMITDFVVKADGSITNITVRNSGRYPNVAKEVVRVLKTMPKWRPATQGGKPVNVAFSLPVVVRAPK